MNGGEDGEGGRRNPTHTHTHTSIQPLPPKHIKKQKQKQRSNQQRILFHKRTYREFQTVQEQNERLAKT